jgi:hypothetical protein
MIYPEPEKQREQYPPQRWMVLLLAFLSVFGFFIKILFG